LTGAASRVVSIASAADTPMANADDGHAQFDGNDDVVVVSASGSLRMGNALTLEAWINPLASPNTDRMILNKEGEYEMSVFADGSLQYAIALPDNTWDWHNTGAIVSDGRWAHVAISFDNGLIKTYLDGNLVDTFQQAAGNIGDSYASLNELRIGGRTSNPVGHGFAGTLDDVRVWNVARSQAEIQATMTATLSGAEVGLAGWWRFDEAAGGTVLDASGHGNDGSLSNGATRVRQLTDEDTPLVVNAASGVLANDRDGDGDVLTVSALNGNAAAVGVATTLASGAQLTLFANGSYRYDPRGAFDALAAGATTTDSFSYTTTDGNGHSASATVTLVVTGVTDAPVISSNGGGAVATIGITENTTGVTTVMSTDIDGGTPVYSIVAGGDGARFSIDAVTGVLSFISAPDFEVPTDANGDNVYDLVVRVDDGAGGSDTQTIAVTVSPRRHHHGRQQRHRAGQQLHGRTAEREPRKRRRGVAARSPHRGQQQRRC
jgi:VCBS repeat-containing protein